VNNNGSYVCYCYLEDGAKVICVRYG